MSLQGALELIIPLVAPRRSPTEPRRPPAVQRPDENSRPRVGKGGLHRLLDDNVLGRANPAQQRGLDAERQMECRMTMSCHGAMTADVTCCLRDDI